MDIKNQLLSIREGMSFKELQEFFSKNPREIEELIHLIETEAKYPLQEYASWTLIHLCAVQKDEIQGYYNRLVDCLFTNKNQSTLRNVTNIIRLLKIRAYRESELIDLLISFIQDYNNKVALQVYSMRILAQYVALYPELKPELIEIIQLHTENKTPAYASGMRTFMRLTKKY